MEIVVILRARRSILPYLNVCVISILFVGSACNRSSVSWVAPYPRTANQVRCGMRFRYFRRVRICRPQSLFAGDRMANYMRLSLCYLQSVSAACARFYIANCPRAVRGVFTCFMPVGCTTHLSFTLVCGYRFGRRLYLCRLVLRDFTVSSPRFLRFSVSRPLGAGAIPCLSLPFRAGLSSFPPVNPDYLWDAFYGGSIRLPTPLSSGRRRALCVGRSSVPTLHPGWYGGR